MASFGGNQRGLDRLEVSHFTDENNVGILSKGAAQSLSKRTSVDINPSLRDEGLFVLMEELYRILNRDDVAIPLLVYVIDDRRQRGRFARTRRAGHQDQSPHLIRDRV